MEVLIVIGLLAILSLIPLTLMAGGLALLVGAVQKIFYSK
jgi:hypothetical protein